MKSALNRRRIMERNRTLVRGHVRQQLYSCIMEKLLDPSTWEDLHVRTIDGRAYICIPCSREDLDSRTGHPGNSRINLMLDRLVQDGFLVTKRFGEPGRELLISAPEFEVVLPEGTEIEDGPWKYRQGPDGLEVLWEMI
jgi:hypothetical protein